MEFVARSIFIWLLIFENRCDAAIAFNPQQKGDAVIAGVETRLIQLESKIATLESSLVQLQATINLSNAFQKNQQMQVEVLTEMIKQQKTWLIDVKSFSMDNFAAKEKLGNRQTISTTTVDEKGSIAFTAYLDRDVDDIGADQTLIFNKVILNEGDAYNIHTGVFTCPQNGLYDFSYVVGQRNKKGIWAKLMLNSDEVVAASADAEHLSQDIQGGNRAFLRLNKGDAVRVVLNKGGTHVEGDAQRFTTFSGILVSA